MVKIIIILLMVFFVIGCHSSENRKHQPQRSFITSDSVTLSVIKKASIFSDLFVQKKIIHLETTPESLIGVIESIIYLQKEQKIIVLDSRVAKTILVFGLDGKFLYRIGKKGEGPGEYTDPDEIAFENNTIVVASDNGLKLLFYKLDGTFVKEISLPAKNWNIFVDNMCLWNNDLYIYDNNEYYDEGTDGKDYRVFRIKNCENFDVAYGEHENSLDYDGGGIILFNNRIVYSGIMNGMIYQILPSEKKSSVLSSLGILTNIRKYSNLEELVKDIKNTDSILSLGTLRNLLFVQRHSEVSIIDDSGKLLKNIPFRFKLPNGFEGTDLRTGFAFYNKGIIFACNDKSEISETKIPNPSLILYELKNNN